MGERTSIEWTDASWTPIRARNIKTGKVGWYCEHSTTGCEFCYAEGMNKRLGTGLPFKPGHRKDVELFLDETMLLAPLRWKKPRMIFVCSMTDLFADFVPDEWIDKVFAVMALCPQHTFQCLTKRAERMREYVSAAGERVGDAAFSMKRAAAGEDKAQDWNNHYGEIWPLRNCWLGVSAERQQEADERIPHLLQTPAAVRFISAEPLLGPIDLNCIAEVRSPDGSGQYVAALYGGVTHRSANGYADQPSCCRGSDPIRIREIQETPKLDWVIVGGESGLNARPMHPEWARSLREQCEAAGVAMFFKQWGAWEPRYYMTPPDDTGKSEQLLAIKQTRDEVILHASEPKQFPVNMVRVGKKAAGRLLDGREHNDMPSLPSALAAPQNKPAGAHP